MKTALFLILSLIQVNAFADCRLQLSQGKDSATHQIYMDHDLREQSDALEMSIAVIKTVMHQAGCEQSEINALQIKSKNCQYLIPESRYSYACYLEATEGIYFMTQDLLSNINVTFNRWD